MLRLDARRRRERGGAAPHSSRQSLAAARVVAGVEPLLACRPRRGAADRSVPAAAGSRARRGSPRGHRIGTPAAGSHPAAILRSRGSRAMSSGSGAGSGPPARAVAKRASHGRARAVGWGREVTVRGRSGRWLQLEGVRVLSFDPRGRVQSGEPPGRRGRAEVVTRLAGWMESGGQDSRGAACRAAEPGATTPSGALPRGLAARTRVLLRGSMGIR